MNSCQPEMLAVYKFVFILNIFKTNVFVQKPTTFKNNKSLKRINYITIWKMIAIFGHICRYLW